MALLTFFVSNVTPQRRCTDWTVTPLHRRFFLKKGDLKINKTYVYMVGNSFIGTGIFFKKLYRALSYSTKG
jgi:hypothetical protein